MLDRGSIHHQPCMSPYIVFKEALVHSHDSFHGRQSLPHHPAHHTVKSPGHGPHSWGFGHRPMGEFPGIPFGWLKLHSWLLFWGFKRCSCYPPVMNLEKTSFQKFGKRLPGNNALIAFHHIPSKKKVLEGSSREVPRSTLKRYFFSLQCVLPHEKPR